MFRSIKQLYVNSFSGLPLKVWYLSLILLINRSGAMVIPFLTVYLTAKKGYSAADASWIMVAFGLGGVVGNYLGGLLNDRIGSWHLQVQSLFLSGVIFILLGQTDDYLTFCLLIFLLSVAADSFRPANRAAVAIYTPKDRLTKAYGLQRIAVNLGFSIGPVVGGLIVERFSYETLFWADGLTCIFSGFAFILLLPKDETAKPAVAKEKRAIQQASSKPGLRQNWLRIVCTANVLIAMTFFLLFNTVPVFLEKAGYSILEIGYIFTFSGILIVLFEMPLVYVFERRYRPLSVLFWGSLLIAVSYFMLPAAISLGLVGLGIFTAILTVGEMLYMPFGSTFVAQQAPVERRGEYLGLLSASYSLAFVLSPLVGLNAAESIGFSSSTYLIAALGLLGSLAFLWLNQVGLAKEMKKGNLV